LAFLGLPKNEKKLAKKMAEIEVLLSEVETGLSPGSQLSASEKAVGEEHQAAVQRDLERVFEGLVAKAEDNYISLESASSALFHSVQSELEAVKALTTGVVEDFDAAAADCREVLQLLAEDIDRLVDQRKIDARILEDISAEPLQKHAVALRVLGVSSDATAEEIKKAYRRLSRQHHPDRHKNSPSSNENFRLIGAAYEFLENSSKRDLLFLETEAAYTAVSQKIQNNGFDAEKDFPDLEAAVIDAHSTVADARLLTQPEFDAAVEDFKKAVGVLVYEAEQRIPKLMKELRALELMYPQTAEAKKSRFERIDAVRQELNALRERFHASRYAPLHDTETTLRNMLSGTESVWNKAYNDIKEQPGFDSVVYLKNAEIDTRLSKN
jgi:curved DNA-binding protein CbpA/DNA-binding ferritin-like protein (Dps family)